MKMCKIPNVSNRVLDKPLGSPKDPKNILAFYIRCLIKTSQNRVFITNPCEAPVFKYYNHSQAASRIFGHGIEYQHYITRMLGAYHTFFEFKEYSNYRKFRPLIEPLRQHHPDIFEEKMDKKSEEFKEQMIVALGDEIKANGDSNNKNYISLGNVRLTGNVKGLNVYQAECIIEDDEQYIQLPEGIKVKYKSDYKTYEVTILEYDSKENVVVFQSSLKLPIKGNTRLENNPVFLLHNLRQRLTEIDIDKVFFKKLFENELISANYPKSVEIKKIDYESSQFKAIEQSLKSPVTFIWGPPGTGKTHTLANLLLNLFLAGERTLVCSIANVAVDGLTKKLLEILKKYQLSSKCDIISTGKILRIGYVHDTEILNHHELFPEDAFISSLRKKIQQLEDDLSVIREFDRRTPKYNDKLAELIQSKSTLTEYLKNRVLESKIILCTSSKALLEAAVSNSEFDNLVIDEGSMMSSPSLLGLVKNIGKRVVIAGDFRQLGPIAIGQTNMVNKWLHKSLFDLLGRDFDEIKKHPYIAMLKKQRRCAKDIIELVNKEFYEGILETPMQEHHKTLRHITDDNQSVLFYDLGANKNYRVSRSASQSRFNLGSEEFVSSILKGLKNIEVPECRVGVISPYRAQTGHYMRVLEERKDFNPNMNIRAGTIHTFQGSECDLIIFDMVDGLIDDKGKPIPIGNLYYGKTGEQLLNVAFTRAKSKLIIVGCSRVLWDGPRHQQVGLSIKRILKKLEKYRMEV